MGKALKGSLVLSELTAVGGTGGTLQKRWGWHYLLPHPEEMLTFPQILV